MGHTTWPGASLSAVMDAGTLRTSLRIPVLLVTQAAELRQMLSACLSLHGYQPSSQPSDPAELVILHAAAEAAPLALASQLGEWRERNLPVLVLGGESAAGHAAAWLEMGASAYLSMPFELEALLGTIQACLSLPAQTEPF